MKRSRCISLSTAKVPWKKFEVPPRARCFSKTATVAPPSARVTAAARPVAPEPATTTSTSAGMSLIVLLPRRRDYLPRYRSMFLAASRPELKAKAEARPEEVLMG